MKNKKKVYEEQIAHRKNAIIAPSLEWIVKFN